MEEKNPTIKRKKICFNCGSRKGEIFDNLLRRYFCSKKCFNKMREYRKTFKERLKQIPKKVIQTDNEKRPTLWQRIINFIKLKGGKSDNAKI